MRSRRLISSLLLAALAAPSLAVASVEVCDRVTHPSHGGSDGHRDLGNGKVMWVEWWAHEGVFKDVWLADCRTGIALSLRTWEERIRDRHVIDRTDQVVRHLTRNAEAAPAFFTVERMANDIRRDGVDLSVTRYDEEFCACAEAYAALRGGKAPFEVAQ